MDDKVNGRTLLELDDKASHIFVDFMTRVTKLEELVAVGSRVLVGFHQELELFRRPTLPQISKVADAIIKSNCTERMKAYVEAGCIHVDTRLQNVSNLHAFQQGLQDHLTKAKALLDELECLTEDVISTMHTANETMSHLLDKLSIVDLEEMESENHRGLEGSDFMAMMRVIYNMLKLDYTMQEKIVLSLNLSSSSSELESYCLMWDLRPFINDSIMHQGWRFRT